MGYHSFVFEPARAEEQVERRLMGGYWPACRRRPRCVAHRLVDSRRLLRLALRQACPQLAAEPHRGLISAGPTAFERADVQGLAQLLAEDVEMTMPPDPMWFRGRADVLAFLERRVFAVRGRLVGELTATNRHPAAALYERSADEETALAIQVLSMRSGRVQSITGFVGITLFPLFGLPVSRLRRHSRGEQRVSALADKKLVSRRASVDFR